MNHNLITLSFAEESKAYQALAELKQAAAEGRVKLVDAVVVSRGFDGQLQVQDGASDGSLATPGWTGTLVGALVGMLGGPIGVLLGGLAGSLIGDSVSLDKAGNRTSLVEQIAQCIPAGATALIASVKEAAPEVIDDLAASLGGLVLRRPVEAVQAEVDAQTAAAMAAAAEARRVLHEQQKAEWKDKIQHWKGDFSEHLHSLAEKIKDKRAK